MLIKCTVCGAHVPKQDAVVRQCGTACAEVEVQLAEQTSALVEQAKVLVALRTIFGDYAPATIH